jgi:biofilm PGA synthesis N-glycosyltransferase PgaC
MTPVEICFWIAALVVVYPYALYPGLAWTLARLRGRPIHATQPAPRSASVVVAAYNEEQNIGRRLDEMTTLLEVADLDGEVIVVTDGSTDATAAAARAHPSPLVRVLELPARVGKAAPSPFTTSLSSPTSVRVGPSMRCRECCPPSPIRPSAR